MTGVGKPRKYDSPETMAEGIEEFFSSGKPIGLANLALHLGFASRQSLYDYEKKSEYSYLIKRAILAVEAYHEGRLISGEGSIAGTIFVLKNMGWSDKPELNEGNTEPILDALRQVLGK